MISIVSIDVKPEIRKTWGKIELSKMKTCLQCTYHCPSRFGDNEHAFYCDLKRLDYYDVEMAVECEDFVEERGKEE